jgi:hypothetical protein
MDYIDHMDHMDHIVLMLLAAEYHPANQVLLCCLNSVYIPYMRFIPLPVAVT